MLKLINSYLIYSFLGGYILFLSFLNLSGIGNNGNSFLVLWIVIFLFFIFYFLTQKIKFNIKLKNFISNSTLVFMFFFLTVFSLYINPLGHDLLIEKLMFFLVFVLFPFVFSLLLINFFTTNISKKWFDIFNYSIIFLGLVELIIKFDYLILPKYRYRISAFSGSYNTYSLVIFSFFFLFFMEERNKYLKLLLFCLVCLLTFFTGSRGNILSIFFTVYVLTYMVFGFKKFFLLFSFSLIIILLIFFSLNYLTIVNSNLITSLNKEITGKYLNSLLMLKKGDFEHIGGARFQIIKEYYNNFIEFPFFGTGFAYQKSLRWDPHNSLIEVLGSLGFSGFSVYILLILSGFKLAKKSLKSKFFIDKYLAVFFISFFFGSLFSGTIYGYFQIWFCLGGLISRNNYID